MRSISTSSIWLIADDEHVHAQRRRQQSPQQVGGADAGPATRRSLEPDDPQRRADERVRPAEAPQDRAAPTPPPAGTPVPRRPGGDSSSEKLPGPVAPCRADAGRLPRALAPTRPSATRAATTASGMEGHFWRITQPATGAVVIVIVAVSRDAAGRPWAMASLAAHPGGTVRSATLPDAWAGERPRSGWRCAPAIARSLGRPAASHASTSAPDARLGVAFADAAAVAAARVRRARPGPRRPRPEPVLAPVAAARDACSGSARIGGAELDLDGAVRLRREELGRGRHAAGVVVGPGARLRPPRRVRRLRRRPRRPRSAASTAPALVVALGDEVRTVVRPLQPLRVAVDGRGWRLPAAASRSRATPTAPPRTCCRCPSRTSAAASTTGRPSISPARCA